MILQVQRIMWSPARAKALTKTGQCMWTCCTGHEDRPHVWLATVSGCLFKTPTWKKLSLIHRYDLEAAVCCACCLLECCQAGGGEAGLQTGGCGSGSCRHLQAACSITFT